MREHRFSTWFDLRNNSVNHLQRNWQCLFQGTWALFKYNLNAIIIHICIKNIKTKFKNKLTLNWKIIENKYNKMQKKYIFSVLRWFLLCVREKLKGILVISLNLKRFKLGCTKEMKMNIYRYYKNWNLMIDIKNSIYHTDIFNYINIFCLAC